METFVWGAVLNIKIRGSARHVPIAYHLPTWNQDHSSNLVARRSTSGLAPALSVSIKDCFKAMCSLVIAGVPFL